MILINSKTYEIIIIRQSIRNNLFMSCIPKKSPIITRSYNFNGNENDEFIMYFSVSKEITNSLIISEIFDWAFSINNYIFKLNEFGKLKML